jgi:hypothetical protein
VTRKDKTPAQPTRMGDVQPGYIAQTACGTLLVTGQIWNGTLVELWDPEEQRKRSATFGVSDDMPVLGVTRKPSPSPPPAAGGEEFDPVRG